MRYENILSKIHLHKIFYTTGSGSFFICKWNRSRQTILPDRSLPHGLCFGAKAG
jgi:hypothetical protein